MQLRKMVVPVVKNTPTGVATSMSGSISRPVVSPSRVFGSPLISFALLFHFDALPQEMT